MKPTGALLTLLLATLALSEVQAQEQPAPEPAPSEEAPTAVAPEKEVISREAAEKAFSKLLSGAVLVGNFTVSNTESDEAPVDPKQLLKPDRYELATVNKVKDDVWLFVYVHKGVPVPLTLKVLWAGNTPVLTLDEFTIAGMGTFSARVMFHGKQYAGTWQHGKKGGLMFGRIQPAGSVARGPVRPPEQVPPPRQSEPPSEPEKKQDE